MKVKYVDKPMQIVWLDLAEVSPISIQTNEVVPALPVVVISAISSLYTRMAIEVSVEVEAVAPIDPVPLSMRGSAIVVYVIYY